jgi:hypothetical protein
LYDRRGAVSAAVDPGRESRPRDVRSFGEGLLAVLLPEALLSAALRPAARLADRAPDRLGARLADSSAGAETRSGFSPTA